MRGFVIEVAPHTFVKSFIKETLAITTFGQEAWFFEDFFTAQDVRMTLERLCDVAMKVVAWEH